MENLGHGCRVPDLPFCHQKGDDASPVEGIKEMPPLMAWPLAPFGGSPLAQAHAVRNRPMPPLTPTTSPEIHVERSRVQAISAMSATVPTRLSGWRSAAAEARASFPSSLAAKGVSVKDGAMQLTLT